MIPVCVPYAFVAGVGLDHGGPDSAWLQLDDLLHVRDGAILHRLAEVREDARGFQQVTMLRILDVVAWMRHHTSHLPSGSPGKRQRNE